MDIEPGVSQKWKPVVFQMLGSTSHELLSAVEPMAKNGGKRSQHRVCHDLTIIFYHSLFLFVCFMLAQEMCVPETGNEVSCQMSSLTHA